MNELGQVITAWGVPAGLVIWIVYGVIQIAVKSVPKIIETRQALTRDQQEHNQKFEIDRQETERLLALANAGSRTFTEEQLTQFLSETFTEFQAVNEFLRNVFSQRVDIIDQRMELSARHTSEIPEILKRIRGLESKLQSLKSYLEEREKITAISDEN